MKYLMLIGLVLSMPAFGAWEMSGDWYFECKADKVDSTPSNCVIKGGFYHTEKSNKIFEFRHSITLTAPQLNTLKNFLSTKLAEFKSAESIN